MKHNHRFIIAAVLGTALATGAGSAMAFGPKGGGHEHMGMMGNTLGPVHRLEDLTPEQKTRLKAIRDKVRAQQKAWREERKALLRALHEGADVETLRPLAEQEGKRVTERILLQAQVRDEVNATLTDAQREQLKAMKPGKRHADRSWRDE